MNIATCEHVTIRNNFMKGISIISDPQCQLFSSQISSLTTAPDNKTLAMIQGFLTFLLEILIFSECHLKFLENLEKMALGRNIQKGKASDDLVFLNKCFSPLSKKESM